MHVTDSALPHDETTANRIQTRRWCVILLYTLAAFWGVAQIASPNNVFLYYLSALLFAGTATCWASLLSHPRPKISRHCATHLLFDLACCDTRLSRLHTRISRAWLLGAARARASRYFSCSRLFRLRCCLIGLAGSTWMKSNDRSMGRITKGCTGVGLAAAF
ncbi:hypothetical protein LF1_58810 [Rubripirellula obstinata]|uniref:Uncharacterized protein n=1 Tax=Rubripirellula obstinata TaxID=406547 RepID=A0A5B1C9D9_9BACT|nr:hypothetical protein LF1_58810 [Rubripirellula obstinata]